MRNKLAVEAGEEVAGVDDIDHDAAGQVEVEDDDEVVQVGVVDAVAPGTKVRNINEAPRA